MDRATPAWARGAQEGSSLRLPASLKSLILKAYLRIIAASGRTIVLGPYGGELGFEVLYWLPFLAWCQQYAGIPIDRCLAISRGGMGAFYPATDHADLYALRSVDAVRLENTTRATITGKLKQYRSSAWDRAVVTDAVERLRGKDARYVTLHPSWMYWLFDGVWENRDPMRVVERHTVFKPLAVPELPAGMELPPKFIAVRFYERHTLPMHEGTRQHLIAIVQALASHAPVVLLNQQGLFADDHTDLPVAGHNIYKLPEIPPDQNFILQAAVLARAEAFVGTYGGVAQWALRYGKPSISFYLQWSGTAVCHRTLSAMLSAAFQVPFEVSCLPAVKLWGMALTQVVKEPPKEAVPALGHAQLGHRVRKKA